MVVLYLDLDCFYVQAELCRRPELRGKPVVIQQVQNGGFIAISYEARAAQIKRGDGIGTKEPRSIEACLKRCPNLQIVPVDMPHNRYISQEVEKLLRAFSSNIIIEKNSIDDFCLDCNKEIDARLAEKSSLGSIIDKDYIVNFVVTSNSKENPLSSTPVTLPPPKNRWKLPPQCQNLSERALAGCYLAREIQLYLHNSMEITSSIGISETRIMSRLIVSMNKPFKLTLFPSYENIDNFLRAFPITRVHGLRGINGAAIAERLKSLFGEEPSLLHLQRLTEHDLCQLFGPKTGMLLSKIRFGQDYAKIEDRGPPKSILVELSFNSMTQTIEIYRMLRQLTEDLLHRIIENSRRYHRRLPTKITIRWRRGPELSTGSQVFTAPRTLSALCHEASDRMEEIPSTLQHYGPALDSILAQGMSILLKALDRYPSTRLTGNRDLNRIGVVASAFMNNQTMLKTIMAEDKIHGLETNTPNNGDLKKEESMNNLNATVENVSVHQPPPEQTAAETNEAENKVTISLSDEEDEVKSGEIKPFEERLSHESNVLPPLEVTVDVLTEDSSDSEVTEVPDARIEHIVSEGAVTEMHDDALDVKQSRTQTEDRSAEMQNTTGLEVDQEKLDTMTPVQFIPKDHIEKAGPLTDLEAKGPVPIEQNLPNSRPMLQDDAGTAKSPQEQVCTIPSSPESVHNAILDPGGAITGVLPDCWRPQLPPNEQSVPVTSEPARKPLQRIGRRLPAIDLSLTSSDSSKSQKTDPDVAIPNSSPPSKPKTSTPTFSSSSLNKRGPSRRPGLTHSGPYKRQKLSEKQLTLTTLWGHEKKIAPS